MPNAVDYSVLPAVARAALQTHFQQGDNTPKPLGVARGVFVTLRKANGALRGCIGHIEPQHSDVVNEVQECAVHSAIHDPRFAAVTADELADLQIEVSILTPPQPIDGPEQLDPARYGVVVSCGGLRGVLLPAVEGVDTVEFQLEIARQKAGIGPDDVITLERFETIKVAEESHAG